MTYITAMQGKGTSRVYLDQNGNIDVFTGGTRAARNHNPGNLRYGDFAINNGAIGRDKDGFAIFPDSETGTKAHQNLLSQPRYQQLTIDQAIAKYAPPSENNTTEYQNVVKDALGLPGDTPMSSLSADQLRTMVGAMEKHEGYSEADHTTVLSIGDPLQNYRSDFDANDPVKPDSNDNGVGTGEKNETESTTPASFTIGTDTVESFQVGDNSTTLAGQNIHVTSRGQEIDLSANTSATVTGGGSIKIVGDGATLTADTDNKYDITVAPGVSSGSIHANNSEINLSSGWQGTVDGEGNAINQVLGDTPNPQPTQPAPDPTPTQPAPDPTPTQPAPDPTPTQPAPDPIAPGEGDPGEGGDPGGGDVGGGGEESVEKYATISLQHDQAADRKLASPEHGSSTAASPVTDPAHHGTTLQAIQLTSAIAGFSPGSSSDTGQTAGQTETHVTLTVDPSRSSLHQAARHVS